MDNQTVRPSYDQRLGRLNQLAQQIRDRLTSHQSAWARMGFHLHPGVQEDLQQLIAMLTDLQQVSSQEEHERRDLRALVEVGRVINSSLDLTTVLNEVMDTIIRLTGAERAFLMLRDERGAMDTVVARNWDQTSLQPAEYEVSSTIVQQVLRQGIAILTTNAQADPRFGGQDSIIAFNLRSILCVPLKVKGQLTGVIYADNRVREGLFTENERSLLSAFADQAAVALENARLFESVRRTLDEVTELKNLMEDIFASIASGVITADTQDQITLCNHAAETILGCVGDGLVGGSLGDILSDLAPDLMQKVAQVKADNQRFIGLEVHPDVGDRGTLNLALNLTPLKRADQSTRGVAIVVDDLTEQRRLEAQRRLFERMVSPAVIDQLNPDSLQLGGHRREITTLFADIRGFTAFSEARDPEILVGILNQYLACAAEAVLESEGTIDKFMGDAILAWYNAPIPQSDHTLRAVRAALAMQQAIQDLHPTLDPEYRLSLGVGIHCGEALLGLVGTERRLDYTAVGDSVNTAKRLQEGAQPGQILISRQTADKVRESVKLGDCPPVVAEGKEHPIEVCEVLGLL